MCSCSPNALPRRRARPASRRSRRPSRAADGGGRRRASCRKPASAGRAPQERDLAGRNDRRGAVGADGRRRPAAAPDPRRRGGEEALDRARLIRLRLASARSMSSRSGFVLPAISFAALSNSSAMRRCSSTGEPSFADKRRLHGAPRLVQFRNDIRHVAVAHILRRASNQCRACARRSPIHLMRARIASASTRFSSR